MRNGLKPSPILPLFGKFLQSVRAIRCRHRTGTCRLSRFRAGRIIANMNRICGIFAIIGLATNAFAAESPGGGGSAPAVPVPVSTEWAGSLLLVIVWLLVAAAIVGPVVRFFRIGPRSAQLFSDDRPIRGS